MCNAFKLELSMKTIRSASASWIFVLLCTSGCNANEAAEVVQNASAVSAEAMEESVSYVIDSDAGGVAGISVGMTETELRETGWPYETRTEIQEGDEYKIYAIRLAGGARLKCTLDLENILARIESSSSEIHDKHGLGAGSSLSELKQAYPSGRLSKGVAEGRYASFVTGTRLIFRFDHDDLDETCFDYRQECTINESIAVQSITIGRHAPK